MLLDVRARPNGNKRELKGPQFGGMYGPMSNLENKPLTKSLGPFFQEKWLKTTREYFVCGLFLSFGYPHMDQKGTQRPASEWDVWFNV
jgi:hypothetical protein